VAADFARVIHSAAAVADGVEHGPGLAHALIYQPTIAADAAQAVHEIEKSASEIQRGGGDLQQLLADARTGHGLLHELIYDADSPKLVHDLGGAAHDLEETARIVRQIAADTQQGKGTIGGLLEDPSVYEDLTTILGNVKRNSLLKALIRYTIVKDGLDRKGRVETPADTKEDKTTSDGTAK
jgi:phospholipid/cholesterol/gamma-HCH transport system substrate-binding protein